MRRIYCDLHNKTFLGHGTSQVLGKMLFNFCAACWMTRRHECNAHMRRVAEPEQKREMAA